MTFDLLPPGVFVTGTDTGVGKTVVSAALMCLYRKRFPVRYWKPIQTGIEQDDDSAEVARLGACAPAEIFNEGVRLPRPLSPHLSAKLSGQTISLDALLADAGAGAEAGAARTDAGAARTDVGAAFRRPDVFWIVEGAGGVLVPINDDDMMVDLMTRLRLPALVVARTTLGTINHTLLTLEALRRREIAIAGVVMVGPSDAGSRDAIERHGHTSVTEMPTLSPVSPATVTGWAEETRPSWRI